MHNAITLAFRKFEPVVVENLLRTLWEISRTSRVIAANICDSEIPTLVERYGIFRRISYPSSNCNEI